MGEIEDLLEQEAARRALLDEWGAEELKSLPNPRSYPEMWRYWNIWKAGGDGTGAIARLAQLRPNLVKLFLSKMERGKG